MKALQRLSALSPAPGRRAEAADENTLWNKGDPCIRPRLGLKAQAQSSNRPNPIALLQLILDASRLFWLFWISCGRRFRPSISRNGKTKIDDKTNIDEENRPISSNFVHLRQG
jgi:hypothetical protein